ncbi:hypothetical protein BDZ89DRAFT_1139603 [Hymenopellis radicata]|nr:hypothetical protein BDZ89DRAFT_1139603 [Hymenopellis radicata]
MPDFEYLVFTASAAYSADPAKTAKPAFDLLTAHGKSAVLSVHHGLQVGDASKGYLFIGWQSVEAHKAIMANKTAYDEILAALRPCLAADTGVEFKHFTFEGKLEDVTSAPDTEFVAFQLPETMAHAEAVKLYNEILLPRFKKTKGWVGASGIGPCIEEKGLYLMALGWESKEAYDAATKEKEYTDDVRALSSVGKLNSLVHVKLNKA